MEKNSLSATETIHAAFEDGGPLESILPRFEPRSGQVAVASAVSDAFASGQILVCEAGTGIGKSLAYLIPAALWTLENDEPVIISTFTRALQEQLLKKDIPIALQAIRELDAPRSPRAVVLKGRSNYVCRERWLAESSRGGQEQEFTSLLAKLRPWMAVTETGDKAELDLDEHEDRLFHRISAASENCTVATCRANHGQKCMFFKARLAAQRADLVVVNHALLFSDQGAGGTVLPPSSRIGIDEAHHLEAAATRQFSRRLSGQYLTNHVNGLVELRGASAAGLLPVAVGMLAAEGAFSDSESGTSSALQMVRSSLQDADSIVRQTRGLFDDLASRVHLLSDSARDQDTVRIRSESRRQQFWSEVEQSADDLIHSLSKLGRSAEWLQTQLTRAIRNQTGMENAETMLAAAGEWSEQNADFVTQLDRGLINPDPNGVYWLDSTSGPESVALCSAPIDVGSQIAASIFAEKETVVLTSATLTTDGSFAHFKRQTGVVDSRDLAVPSPFDYRKSALVYLANDIPEPVHRDYHHAVSEAILRLALAIGGRTLVLFTSNRHLRQTADAIRTPLESRGIGVYAQWVDGSPQSLTDRLRDDSSSVVLGAASMWEGIDVQGPGLSALVVVRLPFDVPTDPLFQARSEQYDAPFFEYSVPRAVLRFRQGFGRLIRSSRDRGVFVVLDRRIISKSYGRSFLNALPACDVRYGRAAELDSTAKTWLEQLDSVESREFEPSRSGGSRG
jgi:DNA polymerase-3 subunit epsilon/ATP-dependent DNA helicase DinG